MFIPKVKHTLKLNDNASISFEIGDADNNGVVDVVFGVRIVNFFEYRFPPINLDVKTAKEAENMFTGLGDALFKRTKRK